MVGLMFVTHLWWFYDGVILVEINMTILMDNQWESNSYLLMYLCLDLKYAILMDNFLDLNFLPKMESTMRIMQGSDLVF